MPGLLSHHEGADRVGLARVSDPGKFRHCGPYYRAHDHFLSSKTGEVMTFFLLISSPLDHFLPSKTGDDLSFFSFFWPQKIVRRPTGPQSLAAHRESPGGPAGQSKPVHASLSYSLLAGGCCHATLLQEASVSSAVTAAKRNSSSRKL